MEYIIVGLGNTGEQYEDSRHNMGRIIVESLREKFNLPEWEEEKKKGALVSSGKMGKHTVTLVLPELLMNRSGSVIKNFATNKKKAERLVVVYDDIDLPFGVERVSFSRGPGGHRGVASVIKSLGTKDFIRLRIGVSPTTPKGTVKKPKGEEKVLDFLMGSFNKKERDMLPILARRASDIVGTIISHGHTQAMNRFN
ncbi:MAG: aminoacyl-tRNA hydrolase [Candidatus Pacebacteria bacterium]|nr:aminoacyl-tRNA hydrolase [Candidatus Paceibacterota bacterium]